MNLSILLRRWELFSHFTDAQLDQLDGFVSRRRLAAGSPVIREGETTNEAYLVESGQVSILRTTPYGQFSLATLEPGDLFGETSFVDRQARSGDVVTVADTDLLVFSPAELAPLLERDQHVALAIYWAFWKSLSRKLRLTNEALTRFFGSGEKTAAPPSEPLAAAGKVHVDLASKRKLFQEQKLSNLEINFLASLSREKKYQPNQVLFREGDEADEMYVVLEGRVMISKEIPGAGEEALAFLERGDYFGEMALIDNQARSANAKAHDQGAVVLGIPREVLHGILDIQKLSSLRLLKILCTLVATRLRELDDKVIGWYILAGGAVSGPGSDRPGTNRS
ncbi:MAG TPA: cyclic nucleotide-binding domain-containing protein [Thermoanaerobaculia bacterium]|nr:cyclic nucleotide-binding domain-containing protein [Thermoanaerobaculia bacterium]